MIITAIGLYSTDILLSNKSILEDPPSGTIVGTLSIPEEENAIFQLSDSGKFTNSGSFSIPSEIDCTGSTSQTGGVSSTGGTNPEDCETVYSLENQFFYIDGNELKTTGSLSFSELTSFHIGVKGTTQAGTIQKLFRIIVQSTDPFSNSTDLGNGWMESNWFGIYFQQPESDWIYQIDLGWLYLENNPGEPGAFLWHPTLGWLWTNNSAYPLIYSYDLKAWLYYSPEFSSTPFYNFENEAWFAH